MNDEARRWGRIGGLTRAARYSPDELTTAARAGFVARFRREVLATAAAQGKALTEPEVAKRAALLQRAHMLRLAELSARARAARRRSPASCFPRRRTMSGLDRHQSPT